MILVGSSVAAAEPDWAQWRGERGQGQIAVDGDHSPLRWSPDDGVVYQVPLPGRGGSTPVVMDDTVYLTAGIDGKNTLLALDVADGSKRWQVELGDDAGNKHRKGSGSNPSVVVGQIRDGESTAEPSTVAVAYFRSGDVAGVDDSGRVRWHWNLQDRYAEDTLWWDLGSSPLRIGDDIVIAVVQTGPSYLIRLSMATGEVVWKADRDVPAVEEAAQTYATPVQVDVRQTDGSTRPMIAVLGADHLTLHEASDGSMVAKQGGFNPTGHKYFRSIASPVVDGDWLLFPYARGTTLSGIHLPSMMTGDPPVRWQIDTIGTDVPTPAVRDGVAYVIDDGKERKGTVAAVDLSDGSIRWTLELPRSRGGYTASPLLVGPYLYVVREDATTLVVGPVDAAQPELVATNELEVESRTATVASPTPLGGGGLLIRTADGLVRVGK